MSYGKPDVYYQPEHFGLTQVAEIDYSTGSYEFDLRVIWRHEGGALYTARDAGCSCPSPFEDYQSLESLDRFDISVIEAEVKAETRQDDRTWGGITSSEAQSFLMQVRGLATHLG